MNILVITQSPSIIGGANRSLLDVINILQDKYKHKCVVLAPAEGEFTEAARALGCNCIVSNYKQTSFVEIHDWKYFFRWLLFVKSIIYNRIETSTALDKVKGTNIKYDVVYINDTTNTFGFNIAQRLNLPFVWHFRGYQKVIKRYLFNEKSLRNSSNGVIINISNAMQMHMLKIRKLPKKLMCVIYNGVVNYSFGIQRNANRVNACDDLHCIHCGHISKAKGMEDSISAISILHQRGINNIYLHIAGSPSIENGERYDEFLRRKFILPNNIKDNIVFEGEVKNVALLRSSMDIELMCSVSEPFGRTTVEGLQAGLVVIGANTGATPEIIQNNVNGLLYEQGNPKDLADKIESIYCNIQLQKRLSKEAVEFSKTNFTMENNVKQINEILERVKRKQG